MLGVPEVGVRRSINEHNSDLSAVCDWIEACVLFDDKEISTTDVVDSLMEEGIYESQDYAREFASNVWDEIHRRTALFHSPTNLRIDGQKVVCDDDWTADPAYSFCLALSLAKIFPHWSASFGNDYTEQGELFESLTIEALVSLMPKWTLYKTGWSVTHKNKLAAVVEEVVQRTHEIRGAEVAQWLATSANEEGLDVIMYREFPDLIAGIPLFMIQCASGKNWEDKLHEPNLGIWGNIVSFASKPIKAFAMPFCLTIGDLRMTATKIRGPLFDRYRILGARTPGANWPSEILSERLIDWAWPRVSVLPPAN